MTLRGLRWGHVVKTDDNGHEIYFHPRRIQTIFQRLKQHCVAINQPRGAHQCQPTVQLVIESKDKFVLSEMLKSKPSEGSNQTANIHLEWQSRKNLLEDHSPDKIASSFLRRRWYRIVIPRNLSSSSARRVVKQRAKLSDGLSMKPDDDRWYFQNLCESDKTLAWNMGKYNTCKNRVKKTRRRPTKRKKKRWEKGKKGRRGWRYTTTDNSQYALRYERIHFLFGTLIWHKSSPCCWAKTWSNFLS